MLVEVDYIKEKNDNHCQLHIGQFHCQPTRKISGETLLGTRLFQLGTELPAYRLIIGDQMQERQKV
jgi:hypothetical protein